ncbi:Protein of unknown function [Pyronema omphalodes CBS 100304]|uniref:Uncharacterized protein n=1 Tax=Pyronema omphalodes (strain CBS 100304) TaxID=1076935 RepID=U4LII5_PYROM|nr:Protein of unknown function [Pyronema omphalodes CBS 100304]
MYHRVWFPALQTLLIPSGSCYTRVGTLPRTPSPFHSPSRFYATMSRYSRTLQVPKNSAFSLQKEIPIWYIVDSAAQTQKEDLCGPDALTVVGLSLIMSFCGLLFALQATISIQVSFLHSLRCRVKGN